MSVTSLNDDTTKDKYRAPLSEELRNKLLAKFNTEEEVRVLSDEVLSNQGPGETAGTSG